MKPMEYVTTSKTANEQLLYFTTNSLSADDSVLYYLSDEDGMANIWSRDLTTGLTQRLSDNRDGVLKSYVYFRGMRNQGLGKASVSLDGQRGIVYYLQGNAVMKASRQEKPRQIALLPEDQVTAFTHISSDGRYLCVPTTDERALEDEEQLGMTWDGCGNLSFDIDKRVRNERLSSYLRVFDTQTGECVMQEPVPEAWVTHVQFSPSNPRTILYNHEWCADNGIRRMWLFENGQHIRLRQSDSQHLAQDWACHEMWLPEGDGIIYHGGYKDGGYFVGRVDRERKLTELRIDDSYSTYGHFTMGCRHPSWLVTDGYYHDEKGHAGYISLLQVDWESGTLNWKPLCRHQSSWTTQDSHPHPIFDHKDMYVYFTGQLNGKLKVCRVPVNE